MGAFDGLTGGFSVCPDIKTYDRYFSHQPGFHFFKSFGLAEFKKLIETAIKCGDTAIYVPSLRENGGHIRLETWYAKSLLDQIIMKNDWQAEKIFEKRVDKIF